MTVASTPTHEQALAEFEYKRDQIRYACDVLNQLGRDVVTQAVRDWLTEYGVTTSRPNASLVVNEWRRQQGLDETGDMPRLTPQALAQLDAARAPSTHSEPVATPESDQPVPGTTPAAPQPAPATPEAAAGSDRAKPSGAGLFYLVAALATVLSADTSYRFFGHLGISGFVIPVDLWGMPLVLDIERSLLFGVQELMLVACAVAMRAHVRRWGSAGPAQVVAWALLGGAAVAAVGLAGFTLAAGARIAFGPLLALVALHLALGLELRVRRGSGESNAALARIGREMRERVLSRLGLGDDERDAAVRARDRAVRRAAHLATAEGRIPWRQRRLRRALRVSNAAHDASARDALLRELALLRHADALQTVPTPSPWT